MAAMWDLYENFPRSKAKMPLFCTDKHGGRLYLRKHDGDLYAAHYPSQSCKCPSIRLQPESPGHQNMKEYARSSLESAGYKTANEFTTAGRRTRLDVAVLDSPFRFGVEAQFSSIPESQAKRRTTLSHKAGITPLWLPGSRTVANGLGHRIPVLRHNDQHIDWSAGVPSKSSVIATSVRRMTAMRCSPTSEFSQCPVSGRGPCGQWHPWWNDMDTGWHSLWDALIGIAQKRLMPLEDFKGVVRIVPADDFPKYVELTGHDGIFRSKLVAQDRNDTERTKVCTSERLTEITPIAPALRAETVAPLETGSMAWREYLAARRRGFMPPSGPGRCHACGFHVPTQSHRDGCPISQHQTRTI